MPARLPRNACNRTICTLNEGSDEESKIDLAGTRVAIQTYVYKNRLRAAAVNSHSNYSCISLATEFTLPHDSATNMYGKALVGSGLVLALSAIQSCPAPPIAIGIGMAIGVPLGANLLVRKYHPSLDHTKECDRMLTFAYDSTSVSTTTSSVPMASTFTSVPITHLDYRRAPTMHSTSARRRTPTGEPPPSSASPRMVSYTTEERSNR
jgi:hypothetical protein